MGVARHDPAGVRMLVALHFSEVFSAIAGVPAGTHSATDAADALVQAIGSLAERLEAAALEPSALLSTEQDDLADS
jgi:hypothetical protein